MSYVVMVRIETEGHKAREVEDGPFKAYEDASRCAREHNAMGRPARVVDSPLIPARHPRRTDKKRVTEPMFDEKWFESSRRKGRQGSH